MKTIQVVLDVKLLKAADRAAEREARDRAGYRAVPDSEVEVARWEAEAAWPDD